LLPQLKVLWEGIDRLATEHGWYEPELQSDAIYRVAMIDNDIARDIVVAQTRDENYDVLGEILRLITEEK
jgi:hypothetical protein